MGQFLAIFVLIAVVIIFNWLSDDDTPRRPDATDSEVTYLPGPSEDDPVVVVKPSANDRGVAVQRYTGSEFVELRSVCRQQFILRHPVGSGTDERPG